MEGTSCSDSLKVRKLSKEVPTMAHLFWLSVLARYALCGVMARAREMLCDWSSRGG